MTQPAECGVRIAGVGSALPSRVLTNADLEKMVDTSDEWIIKRTGIRTRRICNPDTEGEFTLARDAMKRALDDAGMELADLDMLIHASTTSEMTCPPNACRIAASIGKGQPGAFDLVAACCGLVYGMNVADSMIRAGRSRAVGIIGCDELSRITDYEDRSLCILFGDAAGAVVLTRDDDPASGCVYQTMGSDGSKWDVLYLPNEDRDIPEWDRDNPIKKGCLRMSGQEVFKFAVSKFRRVIRDALEATGLTVDDVSQFICHQSNIRIIETAKEKLGLPDEKVYINIDRVGNTSAASIGVALDELWKAGRVKRGDWVVLAAFGGGLTWACSVWKV